MLLPFIRRFATIMGFTLNTLCIDHFPLNTFLSSLFILLRRSLYLYDWVREEFNKKKD